ncbi:MAG: CvpA family protein [Bacteroidales bacterium]|nr:CvpA family protein [Bacteroidales bacterium]
MLFKRLSSPGRTLILFFTPILKMILLDILLAVPLCFLIFMGWKKGLVREIATLAGILVGLWASIHLSQLVAPMLGLNGESAVLTAFIVVFLVALVLTYLLGRCVEGLMKAAKLSLFNRLAGALLGAAKALCILAVLLNFMVMVDGNEKIIKPSVKEQSMLYKPVYKTGNMLMGQLKDFIAEHREEWKEVME